MSYLFSFDTEKIPNKPPASTIASENTLSQSLAIQQFLQLQAMKDDKPRPEGRNNSPDSILKEEFVELYDHFECLDTENPEKIRDLFKDNCCQWPNCNWTGPNYQSFLM